MRLRLRALAVLTAIAAGAALLVAPNTAAADPAVRAAAGPQGSLRAADPFMVRDGDRWVSMSTNESMTAPYSRPCPGSPLEGKSFAYFPYRVGPAPDQLADCWSGDVMPNGPGPWAQQGLGLLWAPTMAKIGDVWWFFYVARLRDSGQQCIGVAAGDRATGPNWIHAQRPLVCPEDGLWAIDPDIFYDRQTRAWYLMWDHRWLKIQRFDPATGALVGPVRELLHETHPDLGFDEFRTPEGGTDQTIENPTMVRADSGELWLFFAANMWPSGDYATGWALCGAGAPTEGGGCAIVNSFDPGSRYRPWWGWSQRRAPVEGVDARPAQGFPDLPGFGGMSLAVANPTGGVQPVYAAAHIFWGGPSNLRTQVVYRLQTTGITPVLTEP